MDREKGEVTLVKLLWRTVIDVCVFTLMTMGCGQDKNRTHDAGTGSEWGTSTFSGAATDPRADGDAESDSDGDADFDSDGKADSDGNSDSDSDGDADSDWDSDSVSELDSETVKPEILKVFELAKEERAHEAAMCSCFIPGWGQMLKGDDAKGRVIMIASGITLFATTMSWIITQTKYNDYASLGPDDVNRMDELYETYNRWYRTSLFTSTIFLSIYVYSICDAMFTKTKPQSPTAKSKEGFSCILDNERISINYTLSF